MIRRREILSVEDGPRGAGDVRGRGERGDTLIEVLLALMVLGLTAVALLLAFSTSISGSARHREIATANTVLDSASQLAIAQIQANSNLFSCNFASPETPTTFVTQPPDGVSFASLPTANYGSFSASVSNVEYWNGTSFQDAQNDPTALNQACLANVPMEVTVEVQGSGMTLYNSFVVNLPSGSLGASSNTSNGVASQLVFTSPTNSAESATGEPGVPFSPQPVISVLDNQSQLDATDLSPIVLSIESPNYGATISGCTADDPHGQATFSGCVITGPSATYVIQATVLGQSLVSDPSGPGVNANSVNSAGSFWQSAPNWYTTTFSVTVSGSPDQVTFIAAPVAATSGALLQTQPLIQIINPLTHLVDTSATGTVTLTLSGGELASCTNNAPGKTVTTSADEETITTNATLGVVSLANCTFSGAIFYNAAAYPAGPDATTYSVTASYTGAVPATSSIAVTGPGTNTSQFQLSFVTQPGGVSSTSASSAFSLQPAVEIEDAFGNPEYNLASATVNLSFASVGTATESISSYTQSLGTKTGIVTFSNVAGSNYGGGLELTATYSLLTATSSAFSISPQGGETMAFTTQPVAGPSGATLSTEPVITIYDSKGHIDTGLTSTINLTPSGGSLPYCTGLTPNYGVVDVTTCSFLGTVGQPYTLTASFTNSQGTVISVQSQPITPTSAGTPTAIAFATQPIGGTVAGSLLATQPSLQIVDSWGNVVTSSSATISLTTTPSGGTLSNCGNLTAVAGVVNATGCTFGGSVSPVTYTMTASSLGLTPVTSSAFHVTQGGTPVGVTISAAPTPVSASNVTDSTLTIQLVDAWQNPTTSTSATNLTLSSTSARGFFSIANGQSGTLGATAAVSIPSGIGSIPEYYGDENAGTATISAKLTATQAAYGSGTLSVTAKTTLDTASVVQGNSQAATVNTAFTTALEVQVIDQFGNPVPNVAVTFTAPASGASGAFASGCTSNPNGYTCIATTNASGDATATTLTASTTAGTFSVVASNPNVATPATFSLHNIAGAASKIAITTQPAASVTAGTSASMSVSVEDTYGNLVSSTDSISVALTPSGFVGATTTVTATGGVANFTNLPIDAAGSYTITATDGAHTAWTATTSSFTVIAAAPSKIAITNQPAASVTAGTSASMSVSIEDTYGNVTTSTDSISVALTPSGFVGATTTVTATGGVANFTNLPIDAAGSYTITATDGAHTAWTATTSSFTVIAAAPSQVIWTTSPGTSIAGSAVVGPPTVKIEDAYNNLVSGAVVNMAVTTGPGVFIASTTSVTTSAPGTAAFPSLFLQAAGNYTITASAGSASATSSSFTVNAASAHAIMVWGGSGQSATVNTNFASPFSAFVTDTYGNPVSGATVTFTAPASGAGGTFHATTAGGTCLATGAVQSSCTATTNANGIATSLAFTANGTAGKYTNLSAAISGATTYFTETNTKATLVFLTSAQSFATNNTDSGTSSGSVIIQAQDGAGNPVVVQTTAVTVALAYATTGVTLTTDPASVVIPVGASSVAFTVVSSTSTNGGTFTITATNGSYVLATQTETVLKNASATGNAFTAIATQNVSPTNQTAAFPVKITNTTGATEYYEVSSPNGLLTDESASPSSACLPITNNNNGTITDTVTTDETLPAPSRPSGSYTLDFVVQEYPNTGCTGTVVDLQVDATLTVTAGSASVVSIAGGAGQFTPNGTAFTNALTVFVSDADGNPITSGVTVTFTAPSSGASGMFRASGNGGVCLASGNGIAVTSCTATTNAYGIASSLSFTAIATAGNYNVAVTTTPTLSGSPLSFPEDNT